MEKHIFTAHETGPLNEPTLAQTNGVWVEKNVVIQSSHT